MIAFLVIFLVYIAALMTIAVWALLKLLKPALREEHRDPKERRPILNEVKRMVGIKRKGSIIIPPSDGEIERERIIQERRAQGLDTPVEMLRDNDEN